MIKIIFAFICFVATLSNLSAQQATSDFPNEWKLLRENEHVKIFYKGADCYTPAHGTELQNLIFKVENKTNQEVFLHMELDKTYSDESKGGIDSENEVRLVLKPYSSLEGVCYPESVNEHMLSVFLDNKSVKNMTKLEKINIKGLKTQILK